MTNLTAQSNCLTSGRIKFCLIDGGVQITETPMLGQPRTKTIAYKDIKKVKISFMGMRILMMQDKDNIINVMQKQGDNYGYSFEDNQTNFYPWKHKQWAALVDEIRSKIPPTTPTST